MRARDDVVDFRINFQHQGGHHMSFTIVSVGTPGSGYDFQRGEAIAADSIDALHPAYRHLIDDAVTVTLATVASDGHVQLSPMWFEASPDRSHVHINTAKGRTKDHHMRRSPKVSIQAINPLNPYHWVTIYGAVDRVIEESGDDGHLATESIDRLAKTYLKADSYPFRREGEERVLFQIKPSKIVTFGHP
jgi:PPOX class probable F420-dependent enzyme